ncbi:MAG TPA: hypothetical protein VMB73_34575, partial [Acetobacteraceae bacterium]|nr:hypothetical protein [Acetobacteraceae bacterium]
SLLLWLDEDAIADLARVAIDLWAWRTAVITFAAAPQRLTMREPDIRPIDDRTRDERAARIEFLRRILLEPDIPEDMRAGFGLEMGDLAASLGRAFDAESAYRAGVAAAPDEHARAVAMGRVADILQARGELDEALRIRREEELPVYERLGDVRSRAVTMGKIADILQARGELDEALRIRREETLPVYERLGDVHSRAVALYRIARLLIEAGGLDDARALEIHAVASEAFTIARRLKLANGVAHTGALLAQILARAGRISEALPVLDEAEAAFAKLSNAAGVAHVREIRKTLTESAG